jgi:rare lipoprotein A
MTRVLTQTALALLLAGTLGAAPGQKTSDSRAKETPHSPTVKTIAVSSDKSSAPALKSAKAMMTVPKKSEAKPYQVGNASWYGELFQGKETASGETYDMYRYTAAHMQLPLGTWVKVTNLKNNKFVVVRVNDRGPVTPGRIIDLSYSAAKQLNMAGRGVAKVRVDVIPSPANPQMGNKPTVLEAGLR